MRKRLGAMGSTWVAVCLVAGSLAMSSPTQAQPSTPAADASDAALDPALITSMQRATTTSTRSTDPTVAVELLTADQAAVTEVVLAAGGSITGSVPGAVLQVRLPISKVRAVAANPAVSLARAPQRLKFAPSFPTDRNGERTFGPTTGQAPALTNADDWHAAGITGVGAKVGIVDYFDISLWNAAEQGTVPSVDNGHLFCKDTSGYSPSLCIGADIDDSQGSDHGVAVAEIIKDMAPGAELFIAQVATNSDLRDAIDFFAANGVTILSRSLINPYDGAGDGTGPTGATVDYAASKNMVWFNAAGNEGEDMYMRFSAADANGDRLMEFPDNGQPGTDELLRLDGINVAAGLYCWYLDGIRWTNDWYAPNGQLTDYRVEVYQPLDFSDIGGDHTNPTYPSGLERVDLYPFVAGTQYYVDYNQRNVTSSSKIGVNQDPLEMAGESWCNDTGVSYIQIRRDSATPVGNPVDTIEVAMSLGFVEWSYGNASGSASKMAVDSKSPNMVSVGAIDPPTFGIIAAYSSQGPTIDNRVKPEMSAPSCLTSTVTAPDCFNGTSAATPVAAGAAALMIGRNLALPGPALAALVRSAVVDRGDVGKDNVYGSGELRLPSPPPASASSAATTYIPLTPTRILDTRASTAVGPAVLRGPHTPSTIINLPVLGIAGVPGSGVSAVAINLASATTGMTGFVQALPTMSATAGATSSVNISTPGEARSNFAIVPVGVDGSISLFLQTGGNALVDVLGYFSVAPAPTVAAGRFVPITPERWLNTRDAGQLPVGFGAPRPATAGETVLVNYPSGSSVNLAQASALVVYVTSVSSVGSGFLRAQPAAASGLTSATVNYAGGRVAGNSAIIPLGAGNAISVITSAPSDVIVDVVGYITNGSAPAAATGKFVPITPVRAYNSSTSGGPLVADQARQIELSGPSLFFVPTGALAIVANLTVGQPSNAGFLKAYSLDDAPTTPPPTASVNYSAGLTAATGSLVKLSNLGKITVLASQNTQFYLDINGYFTGTTS